MSKSVITVATVFALIVAISVAHCGEEQHTVRIDGRVIASKQDLRSAGVKILVDGGTHTTFAREDGTFSLHLQPGASYLLDVHCPGVQYPQLRVDVNRAGKVRAATNDALRRSVRTSPEFTVAPTGTQDYFQRREAVNVMAMLKNPMVLVLGFGALFTLLLPRLIDTEAMKEMQATMKNSGGSSLTDMLKAVATTNTGGADAGTTTSQASSSSKKQN